MRVLVYQYRFVSDKTYSILLSAFLFHQCSALGVIHSFPTRRSSDLSDRSGHHDGMSVHDTALRAAAGTPVSQAPNPCRDRKSTRLNSSHITNSYAVFCLKKKKASSIHRILIHVPSLPGFFFHVLPMP